MSTVGRIFIVVNLVLTFVLVGYVGAFQYSAVGYRQPYEALKSRGDSQLTAAVQRAEGAENGNRDLTAEVDKLRALNQEQAARNATLYRNYVAEKAAQKAIEESWTAVKERLDTWQTIYTDMQGKVTEYNNLNEELRNKQTELAEATRVARNREVTAAAFRVRADNVSKSLMAQNRELQNRIQGLEQEVSAFVAVHGPMGSRPPVGLTGTVQRVEGKILTVELDLGSRGDRPMVGWSFALTSDSELKAFVRIQSVEGTGIVVCRITRTVEGASPPQSGDKIIPMT